MPSQHKRSPLSVRLPEAEEAALRERAAERGMSVSEAVTEAVRAWLAAVLGGEGG